MNDSQFISILNSITRKHRLKLPLLRADEPPSSEAISIWANCLKLCMKQGISLSDSRWKRVTIQDGEKCTTFSLEKSPEPLPDDDFRVGLQLLMGLLENYKEEKR
ncbi:MAG: hypothetical protein GTO51_06920 [Candidatus Latescibacteria bacterium]|nr:hypothetical protein [Candidatus Latescibacterota bacterium]NIM21532.1 hypothetical protein [Candidatus Latescibacterota bacterium]NIM65703.1 hypothetical protein [Candidatus Latescibacterota bacterium]NIO02085.1 hypothetical protein [Candidatus Latescibacterota bacterium]NIO28897.1 hypothetical protein [Candidatus Latescibacterota bacterium]